MLKKSNISEEYIDIKRNKDGGKNKKTYIGRKVQPICDWLQEKLTSYKKEPRRSRRRLDQGGAVKGATFLICLIQRKSFPHGL